MTDPESVHADGVFTIIHAERVRVRRRRVRTDGLAGTVL